MKMQEIFSITIYQSIMFRILKPIFGKSIVTIKIARLFVECTLYQLLTLKGIACACFFVLKVLKVLKPQNH